MSTETTSAVPTGRNLWFLAPDLSFNSDDRSIPVKSCDESGLIASLEAMCEHQRQGQASFLQVDLGDLPARLSTEALAAILPKIWALCADRGKLSIRVPYANHDRMKKTPDYVQAFWPEDLQALLQDLGLNFDGAEVGLELDSAWQKKLDAGEYTPDELAKLAGQEANVVEWINIELLVRKSSRFKTEQPLVSNEMRKQLMEQLERHQQRGDSAAAETIRKFLVGFTDES